MGDNTTIRYFSVWNIGNHRMRHKLFQCINDITKEFNDHFKHDDDKECVWVFLVMTYYKLAETMINSKI